MNSKQKRLDKALLSDNADDWWNCATSWWSATQGEEAERRVKFSVKRASEEYEDDAQRLTTLELDGNLVARNVQRLAQVDRALEKISEGTYGFPTPEQPIPKERLEANRSPSTPWPSRRRVNRRATRFQSKVARGTQALHVERRKPKA